MFSPHEEKTATAEYLTSPPDDPTFAAGTMVGTYSGTVRWSQKIFHRPAAVDGGGERSYPKVTLDWLVARPRRIGSGLKPFSQHDPFWAERSLRFGAGTVQPILGLPGLRRHNPTFQALDSWTYAIYVVGKLECLGLANSVPPVLWIHAPKLLPLPRWQRGGPKFP